MPPGAPHGRDGAEIVGDRAREEASRRQCRGGTGRCGESINLHAIVVEDKM